MGSLPLGMMDALTSAEANTIFHSHRLHPLPKQKAVTPGLIPTLNFQTVFQTVFQTQQGYGVDTNCSQFAPTLAFSALHSLRHVQMQQYQ